MRALWRLIPSAASQRYIFRNHVRRIATDSRVFQEGDCVLLREISDKYHIFVKRLDPEEAINNHHGTLPHKELIERRVRDVVQTSKGVKMRLYEPSLDEYVRYSPRLVTPIYPSDANVIVQLLDLHPTTEQGKSEDSTSPRLEILEAGTGHGGLTLHLARAIHAANAPHPRLFCGTDGSVGLPQNWLQSRRAIVHTIDIKEQYSKRARKTVLGFRRGLYYADVDFYVGDVSEFIENQISKRSSSDPFLSAAILDMPSADRHLEVVSKALRVDGKLVVFNPSVTQIGDCIKQIRKQNLPLSLDTVVELGVGMSAGREWDVRVAAVRARQAKPTSNSTSDGNADEKTSQSVAADRNEEKDDEGYDSEPDNSPPDQPEEPAAANPEDEDARSWAMVCRPKVGKTVIGGGFVGLWSKMRREE